MTGFGVFFPFVSFSKPCLLPPSLMKHENHPSLPASSNLASPSRGAHVRHPCGTLACKDKYLLCSPSRRQWYAAMSFSSCCLLVSRFSRSRCCCSVSTLISPISASSLEMTEPRFCSSMSCQCLASYKEFSRPLFCKGRTADIKPVSFHVLHSDFFIQLWPISLLNMLKYYPPSNLGEIIIEYEGTEDCNLGPCCQMWYTRCTTSIKKSPEMSGNSICWKMGFILKSASQDGNVFLRRHVEFAPNIAIKNPVLLTKVLRDSVSACKLCILQAVSWNSVLRPSTSSSSWVRTAAVVSACCW